MSSGFIRTFLLKKLLCAGAVITSWGEGTKPVKLKAITTNWAKRSKDTSKNWTVTFLRVTSSYPFHILSFLKTKQTQIRLLNAARPSARWCPLMFAPAPQTASVRHWWSSLFTDEHINECIYMHHAAIRRKHIWDCVVIGTMVSLYVWTVSGWFMFVHVLMFRSVIGHCCFSLDEYEYHTPTPFPHTLSEHQNIFLCAWIAVERYKWTSKMPANYYSVPLLNLSILSPGCQTDCLRCSEQPPLWNTFH